MKALDRAKEKGREARRTGLPDTANPYPDLRTDHGSVTWSRAYRRAWYFGWREEDNKGAEHVGQR